MLSDFVKTITIRHMKAAWLNTDSFLSNSIIWFSCKRKLNHLSYITLHRGQKSDCRHQNLVCLFYASFTEKHPQFPQLKTAACLHRKMQPDSELEERQNKINFCFPVLASSRFPDSQYMGWFCGWKVQQHKCLYALLSACNERKTQ